MLIAVVSILAALGLALAFQLQRRRVRPMTDPDGPRTLMPGMKA